METLVGNLVPAPREGFQFHGACEENVFQKLLGDFQEAKRPDGYQEGDFLPPEATSKLHVRWPFKRGLGQVKPELTQKWRSTSVSNRFVVLAVSHDINHRSL